MKKFRTKIKTREKFDWMVIVILVSVIIFIHYYNKYVSYKIIDLAGTKLEEITNLYVKKDIVPKDVELEKLIVIKQNSKEEIISLDIDMQYANGIMKEIVTKIQNNIFTISNQSSNILKSYNGNSYIVIPISLVSNGALLSNIGPKIPIKLTFYEQAFGNVDVELIEYGINNALLKVYLTITIEQKLLIPFKENKINKEYNLLLGAKVINGSVPSIYGGALNKSSSIIGLET